MSRNAEIQKIFEIADDSLQGLFGYHLYTIAAVGSAPEDGIRSSLPEKSIPLTHGWDRNYSREEFITAMKQLFIPYHTRVAIVAMANIFEVATGDFLECLIRLNKSQAVQGNPKHYKSRLSWVFSKVQSYNQDKGMRERIPQVCLNVDHARRIRNISVHNNGLFDEEYETDAILVSGKAELHENYQKFKKDIKKPVPLILNPYQYLTLSKSHIELLHIFHHEIQRQDFNERGSYHYGTEDKNIEWHRVLFGF